MKKRVIALLCTLALVLGVCAVALTSNVSAATDTFQVGWSRVDINPWVDPNDHTKGILQLPLRGNGNTIHRQSVSTLIDDNGDGVVKTDGSDGLFATCLAVTDDDGDTVLMLSVAIIGGFENMVEDARAGIVAALAKKGIDIPKENIQIQGTHTHNSIDLSQYKESYKDSTTKYWLQDQNGNKTENTITGAQVYKNFEIWYPYLIDQLVASGVEAVENQAAATMSKGQIDAGDSAGEVMNTVRHYTRVESTTGEVYVRGSNFNGSGIEYETYGDNSFDSTSMAAGSAELAAANDTMHCLKFTFSDGREPIALVNWRAHTTQNDRDGTILNVSSCYVNRMSYELQKNGYRSIFIQGAAGNVNPSSAIFGSWCGSSTHKDTDGDGIWEGNELSGNVYGEKLGKVAVDCLKKNMKSVSVGDIKVTNMVFTADAKTYEEEVMYYAGKTATEYYALESSSEPFVYPADVYTTHIGGYEFMGIKFGGDYLYNLIDNELQAKADEFQKNGESYVIASRFHADDIVDNYKETGTQEVDLTAFVLGENVAFVTAPGEMYDRYNSNVTWDQLKNMTQKQIYDTLSAVNEWDKLLSDNVGGSYGTPFVMGYANRHIGYMPNYISYEYNAGSSFAAVGAYESHCSELAKGENEHILDVFASMLGGLVTEEENDLYRTAPCEACGKTVRWEAISTRVNNTTLAGGHYFVTEEVSTTQRYLEDGTTVCVDLNGNAVLGTNRAFYVQKGEVLNIMDTSADESGYIAGYGNPNSTTGSAYYGGSVYIDVNAQVNLYSGTITQLKNETGGTASGGCVLVKGEFNMYGGTIRDGKAAWSVSGANGGNVYVYGGVMNMYGGTIKNGTAMGTVSSTTAEDGTVTYTKRTSYGGNVCIGTFTDKMGTDSDTSDDVIYYGEFNMYGGTIKDGTATATSVTNDKGETANSYAGNIFVNNGNTLNLHGGSVTGGSAGYRGNCVFVNTSGKVSLSGSGSADEIRINTNTGANLTITGLYTGSAVLRPSSTASAGTKLGTSDNAIINTTGLTTYSTKLKAVVSGGNVVAGSAEACQCCGQTVIVNQLTQALWDAYEGNLPSAHYRLSENITAEMAETGAELTSTVCLDLAGHDISVTTGRLYRLKEGATLRIGDSSDNETGSIITAGLPTTIAKGSRFGGLFWVDSGATLELSGGTLTMVLGEGMCVQRGGIVHVVGTFDMSGGTVSNGICNGTEAACYGGNISIAGGGVMNMSGGTVKDGTSNNGTTSENAGGNIQIFANGTLNASGGSITGGTAKSDSVGNCVRQSSGGKLVLSGDASPEEVSFRLGCLDISGTYTGTTVLRLASGTLSSGNIVGAAVDANIDNANISIYNSDLSLYAAGNSLVAAEETTCAACGETVAFMPVSCLTSRTWQSGHYFVDQEELTYESYITIPAGVEVCLDLNGNTMTATKSRLFNVSGTMHIIDSVGQGVAQGIAGNLGQGYGGGTAYVYADGSLYLHSGTLTQVIAENKESSKGGVVLTKGNFYMVGGTITGGQAYRTNGTGYGGNICVDGGSTYIQGGTITGGSANGTSGGYGGNIHVISGTLYLQGGTITGGSASAATRGNCVSVASAGYLVLSDSGSADEIRFGGTDSLTVSGAYTGTTALRLASTVTLEAGTDIGTSDGANISRANITVVGSDLTVKASGSDLVLFDTAGGAIIEDAEGNKETFESVGNAIDAYQGTDETLVLMGDVNESGLTIEQNMTIDLNGSTFIQAITIADGVTLTCMDSQTNDYDVTDGTFTKIPDSMAGNAVAAKGYVKYTHDDNSVSFHKLDTAVESLSVRPAKAGMYYGGTFKGDEYAAKLVETFGVALSVTEEPVAGANGFPDHCKYSAFEGKLFQPGNIGEYTSTILVNILNESNGTVTNKRNGEMDVYGVTYIKLTDGTYIYGNQVCYDLKWAMEWTNDNWDSQTDAQKEAVFAMYEKFPAVFKAWNTGTIVDAYDAAKDAQEEKTLKVLLLGNSHGLDTTNLLMEVFEKHGLEGTEYESVVLGAMYKSGCKMSEHSAYATANSAKYDYYKNTYNDGVRGWNVNFSQCTSANVTLLQGLQDEQWDIVVLQEMNTEAGQDAMFADNDIGTVINYVCQKLGYQPELKWHLVWANPEIPEVTGGAPGYSYHKYTEEQRQAYIDAMASGSSGEGDGAENEDYQGSTTTSTPWIYKIAMPTDKTIGGVTYPGSLKWEYNYELWFESSREVMYQMMVDNVRNHVVGNTSYGIGEDDVIASGTAVQYAINELGMTEQDMYRDYTHVNDYGRLMTAYLWYAELMGLEDISDLDIIDTVPKSLRQAKFQSQGDLKLNATQIQAIIEAVNYTLDNTYGDY